MQRVAGKILKRLRKRHGYTQKELAKMLDLTQSQVSKLERGECSMDADDFFYIFKELGKDDLRDILNALLRAIEEEGKG